MALALLLPLVPAATAPLAPTIVLPAEDSVLASSDRRAAPGGCCYLPLSPLATHSGRICCPLAAAAEKGPAHKQFWFGAQSSSGRKPGLQQHVWEVGGLTGEHL